MKRKNLRLAADLHEALTELPKVSRALNGKSKRYDGFALELSAAEMSEGLGQGSAHYFYLSPEIGQKVLREAEKIIRAELDALLGVKSGRRT